MDWNAERVKKLEKLLPTEEFKKKLADQVEHEPGQEELICNADIPEGPETADENCNTKIQKDAIHYLCDLMGQANTNGEIFDYKRQSMKAQEQQPKTIMKPYYEIEKDTENIIIQLLQTCKNCKLGNVSFNYYPTPKEPYGVRFHLAEYRDYWELVVQQEKKQRSFRDMYKIDGDIVLKYQYSESDR